MSEAVKVIENWKGGGPVHLQNDTISNLAWCGIRGQFRHRVRPGSLDEVTCKVCLRRIALGRPLSRGARA